MEAFSYLHILQENPSLLPQLEPRLKTLHEDFKKRQAFWDENIQGLDIQAREEWSNFRNQYSSRGDNFWNEVERNYIPSLTRGDAVAAEAVLSRISSSFLDFGEIMNEEAAKVSAAVNSIKSASTENADSKLNFMMALNGVASVRGSPLGSRCDQ